MFLSAAEIAAEKLPGLPVSVKRAVNRLALDGRWASRPRSGNGGGLEYSVESLPPAARAAYVGRHMEAIDLPPAIARDAASEPDAAGITANTASARDARLALLGHADLLAAIGRRRSQARRPAILRSVLDRPARSRRLDHFRGEAPHAAHAGALAGAGEGRQAHQTGGRSLRGAKRHRRARPRQRREAPHPHPGADRQAAAADSASLSAPWSPTRSRCLRWRQRRGLRSTTRARRLPSAPSRCRR